MSLDNLFWIYFPLNLQVSHIFMPFSCITISASHLSLFLLCGVEDRGAAHLGQFTSLSVEGPAADLVSYHVSDEEDAAVEAE